MVTRAGAAKEKKFMAKTGFSLVGDIEEEHVAGNWCSHLGKERRYPFLGENRLLFLLASSAALICLLTRSLTCSLTYKLLEKWMIRGLSLVWTIVRFAKLSSFVAIKKWTTAGEKTTQKIFVKTEENKSNRVRTTDAFSGDLPTYLSLNRLSYGIVLCSRC